MTTQEKFLQQVKQSWETNRFVKMTLSRYHGEEKDLQNLYIRLVEIKNTRMWTFLYRYKTKDITKNYSLNEAMKLLQNYLTEQFWEANLFTTQKLISFRTNKDGDAKIKTKKNQSSMAIERQHDKQKNYFIDPSAPFLYELGITDKNAQIKAEMYDKYRQINKFIEVVDALYSTSDLVDKDDISIVDFGSGKSYLTFAIYYYFTVLKKKHIHVEGVEMREDLVEMSNSIAQNLAYSTLTFTSSTIQEHTAKNTDIVIALHACDTATDDTIVKGIQSHAKLMIFSPCCHKYVRKKMQSPEKMEDILKHGILAQRESEIITDGLRAMILEYYGYKTRVFEFISQEATSKNLMITAIKTQQGENTLLLYKINTIKRMYGLHDVYLDRVLNIK